MVHGAHRILYPFKWSVLEEADPLEDTALDRTRTCIRTAGRALGPAVRVLGFRPHADKFPLSLISPASDKPISSTLFGLDGDLAGVPLLLMNRKDAQARGLITSQRLHVWNESRVGVLTAPGN